MNIRLAVLFTLIAVAVVSGQESRASLGGVVTDTSQALIAGASVKLTNTNTGVVFTSTTNTAGQYRPICQPRQLPPECRSGGVPAVRALGHSAPGGTGRRG